uniref:Integrin, alpha 6b n=1 Tax=Sparus aurata TaxID=8175 RepID=A0A671Z2D4_SPAAU
RREAGQLITCGLWLLVFLSGCGRLSAFNLDSDNVVRRSGDPDSLFGFSLAMHRQVDPDRRVLLVGAPRAKALSGQMSKVTGGLYRCDIDSPDCTRVDFDNEGEISLWCDCDRKTLSCKRSNVGKPIESRDIIGRCYVLSQDLTIDPNTDEEGGNWHFCKGRARGHEMFGSCQQGLSATFDKDYHYVIFGAPGAYNWKGVVRLEQKNDTFIDMGIYEDGPFEAGSEGEKNPDLVPAPANSYLGFALDSGKNLVKKGILTVVAGAPRANHSGAVVLLKKGESRDLLEEYTLDGEGLASSFGYDLAVLDLNQDGWQDIVVGAPQYFEKEGEIGGAVYVYINKDGKWNKVKPERIDGPKDSMFGLAVENLGDINQDGYHDFAVGAPYDADGAGRVYLYHGGATGLSSKDAAQVLSGKNLGVKLFGYSLAGNMDLDKNSYPDLAVGSLSDSVFVFRARPVINIKKEIEFSPKKIDLTKKNCGNFFCLDVKVCFTYTANPENYAPSLGKPSHLFLYKKQDLMIIFLVVAIRNYMINSRKRKVKALHSHLCSCEKIKDKLHGIPIDVSVEIQNAKRKRRQSSAPLSPVLDDKEEKITRSEVHFLKEGCVNDDICRSNLQVKYRYGYRTTDQAKFEPENGVPVFSLSDQKYIALEVTVSNLKGDDAYEAGVLATFPRTLSYSAYRVPENQPVTCVANTNGSQVDCELGNPFKKDSTMTFYIILSTSGISSNTTELEINLQPETTSNQSNLAPIKAKAKVNIKLQLSVSGIAQPSQVYYTGEVKGETAMKTESEIGTAITHQIRIINLGKSLTDFGTATLDINWPKETAEGKWLLYLMKISSTGVDHMECTPKEEVNPRKMVSGNITLRAAENTKGSDEGTFSRLLDKKKFKTLSCADGARCVRIRCPLRGLDSNAVITLNSRLWNGTFIEDYSKLHHVEVIVKASLHVESTTKNTVLENKDTEVIHVLTVYPERREAQYGGVPWWIIVLSILFGLMLLALLAFLLWKCGFFKRAKYEDKVPSYSAVRIKREERAISPGHGNWENLEKKPWMTTWHDKEHYS